MVISRLLRYLAICKWPLVVAAVGPHSGRNRQYGPRWAYSEPNMGPYMGPYEHIWAPYLCPWEK